MEGEAYTFRPIAFVRSGAEFRFEAPRQAVFASGSAFVEFAGGPELAMAAEDLAGFERIWLVFCFHLNMGRGWKPKVRPPVSPDGARYGVFATRAPHRPNPIGISAVTLLAVEKKGLRIGPCDLLDGTPILDIKPYIPDADSFPGSRAGWRDAAAAAAWSVEFAPAAAAKLEWIRAHCGLDAAEFCRIQLAQNPLDRRRKRLRKIDEGRWTIGCRTWRFLFALDPDAHRALVLDAASGYSPEELAPSAPDPYGDKAAHLAFRAAFG